MINEEEIKKVCGVCNTEKSISSFSYQKNKDYRRKVCKVCVSKGLKMTVTSELETKICRACGIRQDVKFFHKSKGVSDGYIARCKKCKSEGKLIPKDVKQKVEFKPLTLAAPTEEDYIEMYLTLKKMGYDLNKDIHVQFSERYNLKPNNPKQIFKSHISQKKLGLI